MNRASVVTLNRGRDGHLARLLEGLERGERPDECVVVQMGAAASDLPDATFAVRRISLGRDYLPLAEARNSGRASVSGEHLIFLDVDCIPSANVVSGMRSALARMDGLVCCEIRYLPANAVADGWTEAGLDRMGRPHPARAFPPEGIVPAPQRGLFWSLAFGIRATTFDRLGGFDPGFIGYGAEDTDLAFRAEEAGVPILFAGGMRAYHQHHPAFDPPLQHFADIIRNARRFNERHGSWPMTGWLDVFAERGLIARDRTKDILVLRSPTPDEISAARLPDDQPF